MINIKNLNLSNIIMTGITLAIVPKNHLVSNSFFPDTNLFHACMYYWPKGILIVTCCLSNFLTRTLYLQHSTFSLAAFLLSQVSNTKNSELV